MVKAQLKLHGCSSSWSAGPLRAHSGSQTDGRIPKGFQDWVMTQYVVVFGLLCVEMCLVWSWFGLFSFELARRCYCFLLRCSACLLIFELLLRLFFWYCWVSPHIAQNTNPHLSHLTPSLSHSLPHTHINTHPLQKLHLAPHDSPLSALPSVCLFRCWLYFLFSCSHGKPVSRQRALTVKQTA